MKKLYMTGYEKLSLHEFIHKLKQRKIDTIIDIREIPLSRKKGFSKNGLRNSLNENGIKYYHFQQLGSPKVIRDELHNTYNYINFFKKYRKFIKHKNRDIAQIVDLTMNSTISLMCFEKNCELCHRTILADEISKIQPNLRIIPI